MERRGWVFFAVCGANGFIAAPLDVAQHRGFYDRSSTCDAWPPRPEFGAALEHIMGPQQQVEAIAVGAEYFNRCDIIEAINRVDSGDGVAILTDMFGGTPCNLAISCMNRPNVDVLAGINLPTLVEL